MSILIIKPGSVSAEGLLQLETAGHIVIEAENKNDIKVLDDLALPSTKEILEAALIALDHGNDVIARNEFGRLIRKRMIEKLKITNERKGN